MRKNILISPLDWGLGHATRCIPIIKELNNIGHTVTIATDGICFALLKNEFPDNEFIKLPGYSVNYPRKGSMVWHMTKSSIKILKKIELEHKFLTEICMRRKFDVIISDNRFGFYQSHIPSYFITHQLKIKSPIAQNLINAINKAFIKKYKEVWVPDFENIDNSLAGKLSHAKIKSKVKYIGPLSRFNKQDYNNKEFDIATIVSGPEPQRSIFADIVINQLKNTSLKCIVVLGLPNEHTNKKTENIQIVSHLNSNELNKVLLGSDVIISRSGYSSIMDYAKLGCKAILVPTPGQTEQKYLAKYHSKKGHFVYQKQKDFNLQKSLNKVGETRGISCSKNEYLKKMLSEI